MKLLWNVAIVGCLVLATAFFFRYSVVPVGGGPTGPFLAVKLDRLTGRTWVLRGYHWRALEIETDPEPK